MPQNRAQYTFGQLITLVVELKSSVKSLKSDLDKIHKSKNRRERRLTKVENNSNNYEGEEIKREILDYRVRRLMSGSTGAPSPLIG